MSFDIYYVRIRSSCTSVSIPFEQGDVFRPMFKKAFYQAFRVSIPFEQGDVFRQIMSGVNKVIIVSQSLSSRAMSFDVNNKPAVVKATESQSLSSRAMSFDQKAVFKDEVIITSLNPFRAGRCLSTVYTTLKILIQLCLNPFRAGRCLSTQKEIHYENIKMSQSLSSRAMSFDVIMLLDILNSVSLNPFRAGRCLSTRV